MPKNQSNIRTAVDISVVICTYNRAEMLKDTIKSWMAVDKDCLSTELIIVNNNSTDQTLQVVKSFQGTVTDLKYVFEPRPGLSFARNKGIKEANGEIIAFVDDDVYFHKSWLLEMMLAFGNNPETDCIGGNSIPVLETERPLWLTDNMLKLYGSTLSGEAEKFMNFPEHPFGVNMAFRKKTFQLVGGFNTSLGRIKKSLLSNEEKEFFYRIHQAGMKTFYTPKAIIFHRIPKDRLDQKWILKRIYWQGISKVAFNQLVQKKSKTLLFKDIVIHSKRIMLGQRPLKRENFIFFYPFHRFSEKLKTADSLGIVKQSFLELMD